MSIFRRDTDEPRPAAAGTANLHASPAPAPAGSERRPHQPSSPAATTHIAPGAKITGEVNGTSDLVVDGELEGQVRLESNVTIGAEGRVQGDIVARSVRIGGRVSRQRAGRTRRWRSCPAAASRATSRRRASCSPKAPSSRARWR